jgi:hypothetical protein
MALVDAEWVEIALVKPPAVLAAKVVAGLVPDVETVFKLLTGIQKKEGQKLTAKSYRAARPRVRIRRQTADGPVTDFVPLIVSDPGVVDQLVARNTDPSFALERKELISKIMTAGREMGRLPFRVFHEVRAYGDRNGKPAGAFPTVARLAEVDPDGRVIGLRPYDPDTPEGEASSEQVVRQIRKLYQKAVEYLLRQGWWRGRHDL